jgi:hypothetical protein
MLVCGMWYVDMVIGVESVDVLLFFGKNLKWTKKLAIRKNYGHIEA